MIDKNTELDIAHLRKRITDFKDKFESGQQGFGVDSDSLESVRYLISEDEVAEQVERIISNIDEIELFEIAEDGNSQDTFGCEIFFEVNTFELEEEKKLERYEQMRQADYEQTYYSYGRHVE